jgi:DNA-binding response OmpR family regulator
MPAVRILVVDDEPGLLAMLQEWLEEEGYEVFTADNGWDALDAFSHHRPALTITDLRMPSLDGFQVISRIRDISDGFVLALTALGSEENLIRGLELGADEYLVKPVSKRAFLARVNSLLRRASPPKELAATYSDCYLSLDFLTHEAHILGQSLRLRPTEFRLLGFLAQNSHRVVSHQELLEGVWGDHIGSLDSLKWYISSLRDKVEQDARNPTVIRTFPRVGYRYCPPPPAPSGGTPEG